MNRKDLGNFIYKLREEAGMDRKELAALLGVSTAAICQYENNGSIKTEKLYQLAEIFGVTLDEILEAKLAELSIEEKLEEKYSLDQFDLHQLIEESDPKHLTEYFRRIKVIKDRFYPLMIKTLFKKRYTEKEEKELTYLFQYFEDVHNTEQYLRTAIIAQKNHDESSIQWELEKAYVFDRAYYWDDENAIDLIDYIMWNIVELWDEDYYECFQAMIESMSKIERDVYFSAMIFDNYAPAIFHKTFIEHGAELLYPPRLKNLFIQEDSVFMALDGNPELDERLTNAMKIYSNRAISNYNYEDFLSLTFEEFTKCIDKVSTGAIKKLVSSTDDDLEVVRNIYKELSVYPNLSVIQK